MLRANCGQSVFSGAHYRRLDVPIADEFADAQRLDLVVLDDQQVLYGPLDELFEVIKGLLQALSRF
jgi:hypothetical protein